MRCFLLLCLTTLGLYTEAAAQNEAYINQVGTAKTYIYQAVTGNSAENRDPAKPADYGETENFLSMPLLSGAQQNKILTVQTSQSHNILNISQSGENTSVINSAARDKNELSIRQNGYGNFLLAEGLSAGSSLLDITQNGNGNRARIKNETTGDNKIFLTQNNGSNNIEISQSINGASGNLHVTQGGNKSLIIEQNRREFIEKPMTIYIEQK